MARRGRKRRAHHPLLTPHYVCPTQRPVPPRRRIHNHNHNSQFSVLEVSGIFQSRTEGGLELTPSFSSLPALHLSRLERSSPRSPCLFYLSRVSSVESTNDPMSQAIARNQQFHPRQSVASLGHRIETHLLPPSPSRMEFLRPQSRPRPLPPLPPLPFKRSP